MWGEGVLELEENTAQIYPARMWANQPWEVREAETDKQTNRFGAIGSRQQIIGAIGSRQQTIGAIGSETDYYGTSRQQTKVGQTQQQQESVEAMRQTLGFGPVGSGSTRSLGLPGQASQGGQWSNGPGGSISPVRVQQIYRHILTPYEVQEVLAYPEIFFIGGEGAAKIPGTDSRAPNQGFDDTNGSYLTVTHDHIVYRYEVLRVLGKGAFGQVVKAFDHKLQEYVAVKVVRNNEKFRKQAVCEVNILQHLVRVDQNNEGNVVHIKDSFMFRGHACIVFELMSHNLYEVKNIKSGKLKKLINFLQEIKRNRFQGFGLRTVRAFARSIVLALNIFDRMELIHGDLKPENIVLQAAGRSNLKVLTISINILIHTLTKSSIELLQGD